jgi:hypothetical protein
MLTSLMSFIVCSLFAVSITTVMKQTRVLRDSFRSTFGRGSVLVLVLVLVFLVLFAGAGVFSVRCFKFFRCWCFSWCGVFNFSGVFFTPGYFQNSRTKKLLLCVYPDIKSSL